MYSSYKLFADQLADASGAVILKYFRKPIDVDDKSDASPVTIADRQSEKVMRDLINAVYPEHGIIGEEYGKEKEDAEFVWVLDPIDGTKSFITGKPVFGTLIALLHNGEPVLGVLNQPYTKERWVGIKGALTTFNGDEVQTRKSVSMEKSVLYSTGTDMFSERDRQRFLGLEKSVKLTRYSSDCYAYGLLAMGFVDIVCEGSMKLYDFAALIPIVEGAGGFISDWEGKILSTMSAGNVLALADKKLLEPVLKVLGS